MKQGVISSRIHDSLHVGNAHQGNNGAGDLRKDDILVVTRLDRLARSTSDLLRIAERLTEKSAGLQSL
jgi:Resolvase, N terminal domain